MPRLILASQSPRRRELLAEAGYIFDVVRPAIEELVNPHLSLRELTTVNAIRKAIFVARHNRAAVVLAADTLVALNGEVLGKPRDLAEAGTMLRRLSSRLHDVCTSVAIVGRDRFISFADISQVRFRELTDQMISRYFRKVDPLDKAGAYAAQAEGRDIIAEVHGSFSNVVGLPMKRTCAALAEIGVQPRLDTASTRTGGAGSVFSALSRRRTR